MTRRLTHHDLPAVLALLRLPVFASESASLLPTGNENASTIELRASMPVAGDSRRFLRLRVRRQ